MSKAVEQAKDCEEEINGEEGQWASCQQSSFQTVSTARVPEAAAKGLEEKKKKLRQDSTVHKRRKAQKERGTQAAPANKTRESTAGWCFCCGVCEAGRGENKRKHKKEEERENSHQATGRERQERRKRGGGGGEGLEKRTQRICCCCCCSGLFCSATCSPWSHIVCYYPHLVQVQPRLGFAAVHVHPPRPAQSLKYLPGQLSRRLGWVSEAPPCWMLSTFPAQLLRTEPALRPEDGQEDRRAGAEGTAGQERGRCGVQCCAVLGKARAGEAHRTCVCSPGGVLWCLCQETAGQGSSPRRPISSCRRCAICAAPVAPGFSGRQGT